MAYFLVRVVVTLVSKILGASGTFEGPLSCVNSLMDLDKKMPLKHKTKEISLLTTHLPAVFVTEHLVLVAEVTFVKILAKVDVSVHPHVVAAAVVVAVVLAAVTADVSLLTTRPHSPQHVTLLDLRGLGRRPDPVQSQDVSVVAVGVRNVHPTILELDDSKN